MTISPKTQQYVPRPRSAAIAGLNDNVAIISLVRMQLGSAQSCHFEELTEELNVFVPARSGMGRM
jgi:hypothetical protein